MAAEVPFRMLNSPVVRTAPNRLGNLGGMCNQVLSQSGELLKRQHTCEGPWLGVIRQPGIAVRCSGAADGCSGLQDAFSQLCGQPLNA
eukprot:359446-Pelagomonas_calceolata.AAC.3